MIALHVVAGVLANAAGDVLIAQRPAGKHLAGGWEFPGGKLDVGEDRVAGLSRELREELGVEVTQARPLIQLRHRYPDRDVLLDVWRVESFVGEPRGLDGQALRWCPPAALPDAQLLPADRPVVTALLLPSVIGRRGAGYCCADVGELRKVVQRGHGSGPQAGPSELLRGTLCADLPAASTAVAAGADFIAFDTPLPLPTLRAACAELNVPVFAAGVDLDTAWSAGAAGLYREAD